MIVEKDMRPASITITLLPLDEDGTQRCVVDLAENNWEEKINIDIEGNSHTSYVGQIYTITMIYYENLAAELEANFELYFNAAKQEELTRLFKLLRKRRDKMLANTDYLVFADYPISAENRALVLAYRQALRDLPEVIGAPYEGEFVWPKLELE